MLDTLLLWTIKNSKNNKDKFLFDNPKYSFLHNYDINNLLEDYNLYSMKLYSINNYYFIKIIITIIEIQIIIIKLNNINNNHDHSNDNN